MTEIYKTTYNLECGATFTEGDAFPKGIPMYDEITKEKTYSTGEQVINHGTIVEVPAEPNNAHFDHRMFHSMYEDLCEELKEMKENNKGEKQ